MGNEYKSLKEIENNIVMNFRNSDSKIKNTLEMNSRNVSLNNFKIKKTWVVAPADLLHLQVPLALQIASGQKI